MHFCILVGCCYFLSSAINPFLYSLLSKRFRRGFHDLKRKIVKHYRKYFFRSTSSRANRQSSNHTPIQIIPSASPQNPVIQVNSNEGHRQKPNQSFNRQYETRSYPTVLHGAEVCENKMVFGIEMPNFSQKNKDEELVVKCTESLMNLPLTAKSKDQKQPKREVKESHESEEARIFLREDNNEKLKCRYKVVFKSSSNADTKLIVNTLKNKKCTSEKNIPRCYRDDNICDTHESLGYLTLCLKNKRDLGSYHQATSQNEHCTLP